MTKPSECIKALEIVSNALGDLTNQVVFVGGVVGAPGKNVAAKSGLNKSILDQGWSEFGRQLAYKQEWRGGRLHKVPAHYTSRYS